MKGRKDINACKTAEKYVNEIAETVEERMIKFGLV